MATRKPEPEPETKTLPPDPAVAPLQEATDEATERGFLGVETDPTPNSAYTVAGVLAGEPTPETDPDAAAAARKASHG
ncbi:hypothetical protein ACFRCG_39895 [Embleya sp. NPDC056575]|uniref:hypothetical protein n=1 Tax=unclassified Embleya TaxID=2699296 RepID=UPI003694282D